jgi:hypothetical protein
LIPNLETIKAVAGTWPLDIPLKGTAELFSEYTLRVFAVPGGSKDVMLE